MKRLLSIIIFVLLAILLVAFYVGSGLSNKNKNQLNIDRSDAEIICEIFLKESKNMSLEFPVISYSHPLTKNNLFNSIHDEKLRSDIHIIFSKYYILNDKGDYIDRSGNIIVMHVKCLSYREAKLRFESYKDFNNYKAKEPSLGRSKRYYYKK